jgi:hypothetical protein
MRALAVAIQDGRADLHLTVDELAERSGIPSDDIWRLLGEDRAAPDDDRDLLDRHPLDRDLLDGLAHGLHQPPEVLYRAVLLDAGLVPPGGSAQADWVAGLATWVSAD